MTTKADDIRAALHGVRTPACGFDGVAALAEAMRDAPPLEIAAGTIAYAQDLMHATREVLRVQLAAARDSS